MRVLLLALSVIGSLVGQERPAPAPDPWPATDTMQPAELAKLLPSGKPLVVHVGFPILYRGAHIKGSQLAGPGSKPAGLDELAKLAGSVPHDREIVLYCGCCPWDKCPNVRPAYQRLRQMGFTRVRVLVIPTNLHTDWVEHGYPIEKGQ